MANNSNNNEVRWTDLTAVSTQTLLIKLKTLKNVGFLDNVEFANLIVQCHLKLVLCELEIT